MRMIRSSITVFLHWVLLLHLSSSAASAATHLTTTCAYAEVSAAVAKAAAGDTVLVPACTAVWTAAIKLTKPVHLIGAGAGSTVIVSGFSSTTEGLVSVEPSPVVDGPYRISGFTFDQSAQSYGVTLYNFTSTAINGLRIDHNEFKNVGSGRAIYLKGTFYGVVDANTFALGTAGSALVTRGYLDDYPCSAWGTLPHDYGSRENVYFEDNTIVGGDTPFATGQAGRYVIRYNAYSSPTRNLYPFFDVHGNQPKVGCAGMIAEIYGNSLNFGTYASSLLDHRGGKALFYFNYAESAAALAAGKVREEYPDDINRSVHTMHVQDSYYWANSINGSLKAIPEAEDLTPSAVTENLDFFNHAPEFTGQVGIGCGPLEAQPATCSVGVGYWATTQSCSDLRGMVGKNPAAPVSGTLYKCSTPDSWIPYYVPFQYPHPLRMEAPSPPSSLKIVR